MGYRIFWLVCAAATVIVALILFHSFLLPLLGLVGYIALSVRQANARPARVVKR